MLLFSFSFFLFLSVLLVCCSVFVFCFFVLGEVTSSKSRLKNGVSPLSRNFPGDFSHNLDQPIKVSALYAYRDCFLKM